LVVLDVDSTLIQQEVIDLLAKRVGVMSQVKEITDSAMAGEVDFSESLNRRVALLAGLTIAEVLSVRAEISFTPGAKELVAAVHALGGRIAAVSGGFSLILDGLAEELELDYWHANELEVSNGLLTGFVKGEIVDAKFKANSLKQWAKDFGVGIGQTVAIGDGANDVQMLEAAGFAVAFRPKPILRKYADLIIEENSLLPVIAKLPLGSS
jgi:phosphoserine phosphatase